MPLETSADPTAGSINAALSDAMSDYSADAMTPGETAAKRKDLTEATAGYTDIAEKEATAANKTFDQPPPQQDHNPLGGIAPLLLFAAFGGPKMKGNANALLGATTGVVKGYLSGDAEAYQDAVDKYKGAYQQFKDHQEAMQKTYKELREAYKGRIDADIKALQLTAKIHGDEMRDQTQLLRMKEMFDQQSEKLDQQVKHWTAEDNVAQQKVDMQRKKATADAVAGKPLSQSSLDRLAEDWILYKTLPPFGMGQKGINDRKSILNRAAELQDQRGETEAATNTRRADFKADQAALTAQTKTRAAIGSFEQTAVANLDLAVQEGAKVDRTGSPLVNRGIFHYRQGLTSDPQTARFVNALTTAKNEYAKVISGATGAAGITDSARKEADELFSKITSQQTLVQQVAIAKKEMGNRMAGFDSTIGQLKSQIGGASDTPGAGNSDAATPSQGWGAATVVQ